MPRARLRKVSDSGKNSFGWRFAWAALLTTACLASPAAAQIIDDKMMPPTLLVPPPIEENLLVEQTDADIFSETPGESETPLSVLVVPTVDIPTNRDADGETGPVRIGTFSLLHKVTAKVRDISLRAGEEVTIGALTLTMQDCLSTPPEEPPETKSFLQVSEFKNGADRSLFSGWMFASSPGIHALEHPVYDLWPVACKTEDGMSFTGEILPPTRSN